MDKEKEIEQLQGLLCPFNFEPPSLRYCQDCEYLNLDCEHYCEKEVFKIAEDLYNAGYRKADEVRKETAKEIYEELDSVWKLVESRRISSAEVLVEVENIITSKYGVKVGE